MPAIMGALRPCGVTSPTGRVTRLTRCTATFRWRRSASCSGSAAAVPAVGTHRAGPVRPGDRRARRPASSGPHRVAGARPGRGAPDPVGPARLARPAAPEVIRTAAEPRSAALAARPTAQALDALGMLDRRGALPRGAAVRPACSRRPCTCSTSSRPPPTPGSVTTRRFGPARWLAHLGRPTPWSTRARIGDLLPGMPGPVGCPGSAPG